MVYSGAIVVEEKEGLITSVLGFFGYKPAPQNRSKIREEGCNAMWPHWNVEVQKATSLEKLLDWVECVIIHQREAVLDFPHGSAYSYRVNEVC